jgi:CTP:molybdopterin cytidylyltransferase MocA
VVYAVVLAAGASSRYGSSPPKQEELLPRVLAAVRRAVSLEGMLVVTGAYDVEVDAPLVRCPDWQRGPGASLRCGVAALPGAAGAALVVLADGPELDPRAIDRVVASWRTDGGDAVAAAYGGLRLHPVLLARHIWADIPDEGARALDARLVDCSDLPPPGDVDFRR